MFTKPFLSDLRERLPIAPYINERVALKKVGRNFKGLCPFHNEKTPSFMVNEDKQIFHCFGCGEGGDVIHFAMKFEGLSFPEAVRLLAGRVGLAMPKDEGKDRTGADDERERHQKWCFRVNEIARDYFVGQLRDQRSGEAVRSYLKGRGVGEHIWTQHFLGYADKEWNSLVTHLMEKRVPLTLAYELGLVRKRDDGSYYDFFRHRLLFPITSPRGDIIGFGGRALDAEESAKYLNSPDSAIYHKSHSVYGLDQAKQEIRRSGQVLVVEGYMDVLALSEAGIENAVAPLGTALTEGHLRILMRYTRDIALAFDGDVAGRQAQVRALPLFLELGLVPRAVMLPQGEDPDSFVRKEGKDAFCERVAGAKTLFEFFIDWTVEKTGLSAAGKVAATQQILPWLQKVKDPIEQALYRRYMADRLSLEEAVIANVLGEQKGLGVPKRLLPQKVHEDIVLPTAERMLVQVMLRYPQVLPHIFGQISPEHFLDEGCAVAAKLLFEEWHAKEQVNIGEWLESLDDPELAAELRSIAVSEGEIEEHDLQALIRDCVQNIAQRPLDEQLQRLNADIRRAESEHNTEQLFKLLTTKQELSAQIKR